MKEIKFEKDMTDSELKALVGKDIYKKIIKIMDGQTGIIKDGKCYMYSWDLESAYYRVKNE